MRGQPRPRRLCEQLIILLALVAPLLAARPATASHTQAIAITDVDTSDYPTVRVSVASPTEDEKIQGQAKQPHA